MLRSEVLRMNGAMREKIPTSLVLMEYTDLVDQIRESYSSLTRSHKWWHRVFFALLDITKVNMYVMYLDYCTQGPNPMKSPMTHLRFKTAFCEALLQGWHRPHEVNNDALLHRPSIHMPSHTTLKRQCVVCKIRNPHTHCYQCGFKFMCWKEGCYERHHEALGRHS